MRLHAGLILLALSCAASANAASGCKLIEVADLPVTMEGLRPIVVTKINGADARFLLDTGAFYSMLAPEAVSEYKLPTRMARTGVRVMGIGGSTVPQVATVQTFMLGSFPLHESQFYVGGADFGGGSVGLFGQNLMLPFDEEIDLASGGFRLFLARDCRETSGAYWASGQTVGVIDIDPPTAEVPQPSGHVSVNGVQIRVKFDTGAPFSILSLQAAKWAGITPDSPGVKPAGLGSGIGSNTVHTWRAPLNTFTIGSETIQHTQVQMEEIGMDGTDMLLGDDFFLSHHVYVSKLQRKLYFTYNGGPVFRMETPATVQSSSAAGAGAEPVDGAGFMRRGTAYGARKDYGRALADLTRATELAPSEPAFFFELGRIQWQAGQAGPALKSFDRALELKPDYVDALMTRTNLRLRQHLGVGTDLETLERLIPPEDGARRQLASLYEESGNFPASINQYDLWLMAHPRDAMVPEALNGRCWVRAIANQNLDLALADCNAALLRQPDDPDILDSRGLVQLRGGRFDRAIADYDASLKNSPKSAASLYGRGLAKTRKGYVSAGKSDLDAALAIDPKVAERFAGWGLKP